MLRLIASLLTALALALAVAACGDDDGGATPTGSARSGTPGAATSAAAEETDGDHKTAGPTDEPGEPTAAPTAPGVVPTAPPTSAVGTPAVAPEDQFAFAAQFEDKQVEFEQCSYDPTTALVSCPSADYAIDPPIVGQDISCAVWIVDGVREVVGCTSLDPLASVYYDIQE
jgi:hypothetical protein